MGYKITFKKSVGRDLKRIDKGQADRILEEIEEDLAERAGTFPSLTGKFTGLRKYRVGDYQVICSIINNTALILRITHRRETYR